MKFETTYSRRMMIDPETATWQVFGINPSGIRPRLTFEATITADSIALYVAFRAGQTYANALAADLMVTVPGGVDLGRVTATSMVEYPASQLAAVLAYFGVDS